MARIKDLKRMCNFYSSCSKCRLFEQCNDNDCGVCFLPDNLDEIVDKWADEHPVKTYVMDFFEKFPNATKTDSGRPIYCRANFYGDELECSEYGCEACWNQEMKEKLSLTN